MNVCSRCKKTFEEYELTWVEIVPECHMQIIWTGRGQDESKQKKMEVVCDDCKKEDTTFSSLSS